MNDSRKLLRQFFYNTPLMPQQECEMQKQIIILTRPAWAGFKTAEEGIAIIMSYIL